MKKQILFGLLIIGIIVAIIQGCKLKRMDPSCPIIDDLSPNGGGVGATVLIKGKNFYPSAKNLYKVNIGGTTIPAESVPNDSTLTFIVPKGSDGSVSVSLDGESNCTSNAKQFTYYYTGIAVDLFAGRVGETLCADCFSSPAGIDLDNEGVLIVADRLNHVVRKLAAAGKITYGHPTMSGCNSTTVNNAIFAYFFCPTDVDVDANGDIYVTEQFNSVISLIKKNAGTTESALVLAGKCTTPRPVSSTGDGSCSSPTTLIGTPYSVSKNGNNVYFTDNGRIRLASGGCNLTTIKINGSTENFKSIEFSSARNGQQMIYVADIGSGAVTGSIKSVDLNGNITVLTTSNSGLNQPNALTLDSKGNIFFTDGATNRIYVLYGNGYLGILAGSGTGTYMDGNPMTAQFNGPSGIALDEGKKILYISDTKNQVIRRITFQ